jgi:molybdopterin synthase sulfur carrier subunit
MPRIEFTSHLQKHVACPAVDVEATTLRAALEEVFALSPQLRGYVLDDQNAIRQHVATQTPNS